IGVIPPGTDYIQIGDITRTRIGKIKVLFFAGVNDGIIPSGSGRGGIISDMDREFLQEDGIELAPSSRMQSYTQRLYLYMAMTKPEERLYLSYAKLSEDGRSLRPSYLIKTVREMFVWIKEEKAADVRLISRIWNENAGFRELTEGLQPYIAWRSAGTGTAAGDDMQNYRELFSLYASKPEYGGKLKTLIDTAFLEGVLKRRDSIGRAVAEALYGKELSGSVTRLESYAQCAYQHFLTYGIGLKERELFSFEAKDMGTVFHDALLAYAKLLEKSGYTWFDIPALKAEALIDEAVRRCVASGDYAAVYSSFRTAYMVERIKRITMRTVEVLTGQIRKGSFRPEKFEFVFSAENDYHALNIKLSKEESLRLRGRIDRLDVYEDDTQIYVKIIDYKSGKQSFDLAAIYQGLQLQLVVYLNAAMEQQQGLSAKKEIIPAGILYYHIDDPMIDAGKNDTPEDISRRIVSQLAMKGLVNSSETIIRLMDRDFEKVSDVIPVSLLKTGGLASGSSVASTEEFKIISDYVNWKIKEMGKGILSGNIMAMPAKEPEACAYCSYRSICHYTGKTDGDGEEDGMERPAKEDVIDRMKENICPKEGTKQ
ncbi:MAG TPA: PD-(D/E)XK nuclease family protein, partial [Lachnospiraceae bacterium]|nr:PD-(D/E)XK nuclease family protein [Lachnospiraceae bacterium]